MSLLRNVGIGAVAVGIVGMALGQSPSKPYLSTADRVAIQTFEKAKADARKQFDEAQQGELAVEREWAAAHPGWTINPETFEIKSMDKPTEKSSNPHPPTPTKEKK